MLIEDKLKAKLNRNNSKIVFFLKQIKFFDPGIINKRESKIIKNRSKNLTITLL